LEIDAPAHRSEQAQDRTQHYRRGAEAAGAAAAIESGNPVRDSGVIRPVRDARGKIQVRVTVPTQNGWKAIALSQGARQELFISTDMTKEELERALNDAG